MGELVDTNSNYIAKELPRIGITLVRISQVGDNQEELVSVLKEAVNRSDIIITTGGLGPTDDDITRESISQLLNESMYIDQESLEDMRKIFIRRGINMSDTNIKQANLIPSACGIKNEVGTAPGWWVNIDNKNLIVMPGPPREMHRMWQHEVLPSLLERYNNSLIYTRNIRTYGLGESLLNEKISGIIDSFGFEWGMYAQPLGVDVRIRVPAESEQQAKSSLDKLEVALDGSIGDFIWGFDQDTVESVLASNLLNNNLTVAVMESCTGGLLSNALTQPPGSSGYFKGGMVAYSGVLKQTFGVDSNLIHKFGTVSPEVAADMARSVRDLVGSDIGISTTGVAGPSTIEDKPVGKVYIGISSTDGTHVKELNLPQERLLVKQRATNEALMTLLKLVAN
ncbi:MAG: competence/damage-inducible protein A [SAR202 cluster bacterium]|nr:competence/damage-inducible protein A [SAR202 cluster bacterium]|tara:strand:- start:11205 stop:12392 length:1188 start_codon:yes stop_codon:yes gene_type:complete